MRSRLFFIGGSQHHQNIVRNHSATHNFQKFFISLLTNRPGYCKLRSVPSCDNRRLYCQTCCDRPCNGFLIAAGPFLYERRPFRSAVIPRRIHTALLACRFVWVEFFFGATLHQATPQKHNKPQGSFAALSSIFYASFAFKCTSSQYFRKNFV